jgi:hypothetical protein
MVPYTALYVRFDVLVLRCKGVDLHNEMIVLYWSCGFACHIILSCAQAGTGMDQICVI